MMLTRYHLELLDRDIDLRERAARVGLPLIAVSRAVRGTRSWPRPPTPAFLDSAEHVIEERERVVLADLLELHWERG